MGRFRSGIITKTGCVIAQGSDDSHAKLLEELGIEDIETNAITKFVKVELIPPNDEWWTHPDTWTINIDQDITPDWFNNDKARYIDEFKQVVIAWWEKHIIVDKVIDKLSSGYYRLKRCEVKKLCKDVQVMINDSVVEDMNDTSIVEYMYNNSIIQRMNDNSTVQEMRNNSIVRSMCDNSIVQVLYCNSTIQRMHDNATVQEIHNNSIVQSMYDGSVIHKMYISSTVQSMYDNSIVQSMCDGSLIQKMYDNSIVQRMSDDSIIQEMHGGSIARDYINDVLRVSATLKVQKHVNKKEQ